MAKLYKDSEDNIVSIISVNGTIPDGYTELIAEEIDAAELQRCKDSKIADIKMKRDIKLLANDKEWIIASKSGNDTVSIVATRDALLADVETAETDIAALTTKEEVKAFWLFPEDEPAPEPEPEEEPEP